MSKDRVIGQRGRMPWNVPEEYARYVATVSGHVVVMGRASYEVFGEDLAPERTVVVSRSWTPEPNDSSAAPHVARDFDAAEQLASELADQHQCDHFVAGGESIYRLALPRAKRMLLSIIHGEFEGDRYFPEFDPKNWIVKQHESHDAYDFFDFHRLEN